MSTILSYHSRIIGRLRLKFLLLRKVLRIIPGPPLQILDYKPSHSNKKRALLYYLPEPVLQGLKQDPIYNFSNKGIAQSWVKALHWFGYAIDIINWDDSGWTPTRSYDLVVIHGGRNTPKAIKLKQAGSKLIYFATGTYWKAHNKQAQERAEFFSKRHQVVLLPDRQVETSEEEVLRSADGIVALGTKEFRRTYANFSNVHMIENGAFLDGHYPRAHKDYSVARNNFLFFSGGGNLHKGLDLVLDAFKGKPQQLYVCTSLTKEFEQFYRTTLTESPNIHYEGVVELRSQKFYDLMDRCAYVILPSAAEGCPGSVVDSMQQGLIPVVTDTTGIETGEFGFTITNIDPTSIANLVERLASLDPREIARRSNQSYQHVIQEQSPAKFQQNLVAILKKLGA